MMAADPHPFLEVHLEKGRVTHIVAGPSMAKVVIGFTFIGFVALLLALGAASWKEVIALLPSFPKF